MKFPQHGRSSKRKISFAWNLSHSTVRERCDPSRGAARGIRHDPRTVAIPLEGDTRVCGVIPGYRELVRIPQPHNGFPFGHYHFTNVMGPGPLSMGLGFGKMVALFSVFRSAIP